MPCPPQPKRPPELTKIVGSALVKFWLEPGSFQARCWETCFWLDHHPDFPPESRFNLEISGVNEQGGLFHYLGEPFPEHIDAETFVSRVMDLVPDLQAKGELT